MFILKVVVKYYPPKDERPGFISYSSKASYFLTAEEIADLYPSIKGRSTNNVAINKGKVIRAIKENLADNEYMRVYQSSYDKGTIKLPKEEGVYAIVCDKLVFKAAENEKRARLYVSDLVEPPLLITLLN